MKLEEIMDKIFKRKKELIIYKYCNLDNLLEYNILEKFIKDYNTIKDIASYLNKKSGETLNYFNNKKE